MFDQGELSQVWFHLQTTQVAISHEKTENSRLVAKNTWFGVKRCQIYLDWGVIPRGQDPVGGTALPTNVIIWNWFQYKHLWEGPKHRTYWTSNFYNILYDHLGMYMSTYLLDSFCIVSARIWLHPSIHHTPHDLCSLLSVGPIIKGPPLSPHDHCCPNAQHRGACDQTSDPGMRKGSTY